MVASDIEQPTGTHASRPAVHFSPSRVLFLSPTAAPGSYAPDDDQRSELTPGPLLPTAGSSDAGWVGEMAAAGASRNACPPPIPDRVVDARSNHPAVSYTHLTLP